MWQTVDYKGNTVKWYESELIEKITEICKNTCSFHNCGGYSCYECKHIDEQTAIKRILELIQENEK